MIGYDAILFMGADQVETACQLMMPILGLLKTSHSSDFPNHADGTREPDVTQSLLVQAGAQLAAPAELAGRNRVDGS